MTISIASLLAAPTATVDAGYRAAASLASLGALVALTLGDWSSPLGALAAISLPDALAPVLAWVPASAAWTDAHPALTGALGLTLLLLGLTAATHEPSVDLPAESRAGATAALGLAAVTQADQLTQAGVVLGVLVIVMFVVRGVAGRGADTSELVGAAGVHLVGAILAVPLALVGFAIGSTPAAAPTADGAPSS